MIIGNADPLALRIEHLQLSGRAHNVLAENNLRTLGQIVARRETELLRLPGLGAHTLREIRHVAETYGLHLGQHAEPSIRERLAAISEQLNAVLAEL